MRIPRHAFVPIWTRAGYKMVSIHGPCNEMFSRWMCWPTVMVSNSKKSPASLATTQEMYLVIISFFLFRLISFGNEITGVKIKNKTILRTFPIIDIM